MTKFTIKLFGYQPAQTILTRKDDNGKHCYMAYDICRLLGIKNYSKAVNKPFKNSDYTLLPTEYQYLIKYTGAARRKLLMVNEIGVLKLIMQSDPVINAEIQAKALAVMRELNLKLPTK